MGLDTTHDCWHGAYSSFNRWREKICQAAGYGDINERIGFGGKTPWPDNYPLVILLGHSDCDGKIHHKDCDAIANCLEELLPSLRRIDSEETAPQGYSYTECTQSFVDGLRLAASKKENVEFH